MKYGELTLGQVEAVVNKLGGMGSTKRLLAGELSVVALAVKKLLAFITTVEVPSIGSFVVAKKFVPGETIDGIKIARLGDRFKKNFLPKVEQETVASETLTVSKLLTPARDPAIVTALGNEEKVEITLGQFWKFLKTADQQFWYVAYIRDAEDVLWAVSAGWFSGGLDVEADSLGHPHEWSAGRRFLSR